MVMRRCDSMKHCLQEEWHPSMDTWKVERATLASRQSAQHVNMKTKSHLAMKVLLAALVVCRISQLVHGTHSLFFNSQNAAGRAYLTETATEPSEAIILATVFATASKSDAVKILQRSHWFHGLFNHGSNKPNDGWWPIAAVKVYHLYSLTNFHWDPVVHTLLEEVFKFRYQGAHRNESHTNDDDETSLIISRSTELDIQYKTKKPLMLFDPPVIEISFHKNIKQRWAKRSHETFRKSQLSRLNVIKR